MPYNIIRPNWFMQNFATFWIQGITEQGKILLPVGKAKVSSSMSAMLPRSPRAC